MIYVTLCIFDNVVYGENRNKSCEMYSFQNFIENNLCFFLLKLVSAVTVSFFMFTLLVISC